MKRQPYSSDMSLIAGMKYSTERWAASETAPLYAVAVQPGSLEHDVLEQMIEKASRAEKAAAGCHKPQPAGYNVRTRLLYYTLDLDCLKAYHRARQQERWWRLTPLRQRWQREDTCTLTITVGYVTLRTVGQTAREAYAGAWRARLITMKGYGLTLALQVHDALLRGLSLDDQLAHEDGFFRYWLSSQVLRDGMDRLTSEVYFRVYRVYVGAQEYRRQWPQWLNGITPAVTHIHPHRPSARLLTPAGDERLVLPADGRQFTMAELYRLIETDLVEIVYLDRGQVMICDEEGLFKAGASVNARASALAHQTIVGKVVVGDPNVFALFNRAADETGGAEVHGLSAYLCRYCGQRLTIHRDCINSACPGFDRRALDETDELPAVRAPRLSLPLKRVVENGQRRKLVSQSHKCAGLSRSWFSRPIQAVWWRQGRSWTTVPF
ncbi:MAG: hypothetical protein OHK0046_46300 [Anaerolineae bacterium]